MARSQLLEAHLALVTEAQGHLDGALVVADAHQLGSFDLLSALGQVGKHLEALEDLGQEWEAALDGLAGIILEEVER